MDKEIKVCIVGLSGRLGKELRESVVRRCQAGERWSIVGGIVAPDDPQLGAELPGVDLKLSSEWKEEFNIADVIIDFSSAAGAKKALEAAKKNSIPLIECSTGLSEELEEEIISVAKHVPVIRTRNTSVGVNVMKQLVFEAAKMLGEGFEVELVELHHRYKKDAPSGTAYLLLEEVARAREVSLQDVVSLGRQGLGEPRASSEIGAQAVRGGDVAGEHTVYFFSDGERIEVTHRATSPRIFAEGALRAAKWLVAGNRSGQSSGLFSMLDVLGRTE